MCMYNLYIYRCIRSACDRLGSYAKIQIIIDTVPVPPGLYACSLPSPFPPYPLSLLNITHTNCTVQYCTYEDGSQNKY